MEGMMEAKTHKNTAKIDCHWVIGLLFPEGTVYVTKIENYPAKCFYWEPGKAPFCFGSKRSADDYAFGMLLNGYPAVVMEVPKAVIIKNDSKNEKYKKMHVWCEKPPEIVKGA